MISKVAPTGCFVYVTLPGQTAPVTAARFELTKDRRDIALGRLVYGRHYLARADAVPVDPIELRLASRTYETVGMQACSARCAARDRTIGGVASSSDTLGRPNSTTWTTCCTHPTTARARSASD